MMGNGWFGKWEGFSVECLACQAKEGDLRKQGDLSQHYM